MYDNVDRLGVETAVSLKCGFCGRKVTECGEDLVRFREAIFCNIEHRKGWLKNYALDVRNDTCVHNATML